MAENRRTSVCIICGRAFTAALPPTKEHIIPEALGNKQLVSHCLCKQCNNDLGRHVDAYFVNHELVKLCRISRLPKDANLRVFPGVMQSQDCIKYEITKDGPQVVPAILADDGKTAIVMASSPKDGIKHLSTVLSRRVKTDRAEIERYLDDPVRITQCCSVSSRPVFDRKIEVNRPRFLLAVIKIAYEFTVEQLGESYLQDETACFLRSCLLAGRNGKEDYSLDECAALLRHCAWLHQESIASIFQVAFPYYPSMPMHYISLFRTPENNLICRINLLDADGFTFEVRVSECADRYVSHQSTTVRILADGSCFTGSFAQTV